MNIQEILLLKFPDAFKDFPPLIVLQDDGEGAYIKEWNIDEPEPTNAALEQWALELVDEIFNSKQRELRASAYGTWQEQLDMQFHGTWVDHIEAVKALYPLRGG